MIHQIAPDAILEKRAIQPPCTSLNDIISHESFTSCLLIRPTHLQTPPMTSCFCPKISRAKRTFITQNTTTRHQQKKNRVILLHSRAFQHSDRGKKRIPRRALKNLRSFKIFACRKKILQPRHTFNQQSRVEQRFASTTAWRW